MGRKDEVVSTETEEINGRRYRKRTFVSGSTSVEPIETLGDHLRLAATLGGLLLAFVLLTVAWIWLAHAIVPLSYAALIPTHVVAALAIAWATILFGGFSESKLVAVAIPLIACPLVTVLVLGFARAL